MDAQQTLIQAKKIYPNTTWKINHFKKEVDREYPQDSKKEFLFTLNDFNFCFKNEEAKDYFSAYIGGLIEDFYKVINEMIIVLDNGNHSIIQQKEMKDLLPEMAEYFFDNFPPETVDIGGFAFARDSGWELKEGQGIYIKPKDFTKDYVLGIIQTLLPNEKSNSEKEVIKIHGQNFYLNSKDDNTRYTLAFKIADGTVYKRKEEYPNFGRGLTRAVFKKEIDLLKTELENKGLQEKEVKTKVTEYIDKFRGYLNSTLRDKDNSSNDLFKFKDMQKDTKEMWLNVIEHLNKCNIPICEIFKEEFKKTYKQNI